MTESNPARFFGGSPFIKVLDVFLDNVDEDYSKKEVQELANISKAALFKHWGKAESLGLVRVTRSFGNTRLYTLNKSSPFVQELLKLELQLLEATTPPKAVAVA